MKKIIVLCIFACAFGAVSAFAQNKVVVIPLNSSKKAVVGGHDYAQILTSTNAFIMSGTDVSLPTGGTCVVTATAYAFLLDGGDTTVGPYFRTAQEIVGGATSADSAGGSYLLNVGASNSTAAAATFAWDMAAGTIYRFGCAFLGSPANWLDDAGSCRVTWVCSAN